MPKGRYKEARKNLVKNVARKTYNSARYHGTRLAKKGVHAVAHHTKRIAKTGWDRAKENFRNWMRE